MNGEERLTELESLVESLGRTVEHQQEALAHQATRIAELRDRIDDMQDGDEGAAERFSGVDRRTALKAGGVLGLLGLGAGTASASTASGQVGTEVRPLSEIHTTTVTTGELAGSVVSRSEPVTAISGDVVVSDSQPGNPTDGDVWVDSANQELSVHDGGSWSTVPPEEPSMFVEEDDLSDVSTFYDRTYDGGSNTLVEVTGEGYLIDGSIVGDYPTSLATGGNRQIDVIIDGVTNQVRGEFFQDHNGDYSMFFGLPPIHFDSSLTIEYGVNRSAVTGHATVKML